jgi:hypothetical protein
MTVMTRFDHSLVWLRRDLRLFDQAALHQALLQSRHVYVAFIFDKAILTPLLENGAEDRRVAFIHASLLELDAELKKLGASLIVRHADAADALFGGCGCPRTPGDLPAARGWSPEPDGVGWWGDGRSRVARGWLKPC